ncbi:hypothetical protein [Streptosporangium carneum]|uniref:Kinase n=1 Tax=Streptosporangium carneum TaxID=47481 RepID=A0A9W6I6S5_9ACTN|nr:hypothetical protein [Streptosporangium carneum]GLK12742.1 kinase [Streptosporangium carneum]
MFSDSSVHGASVMAAAIGGNGTGSAFGTFGELLQGMTSKDRRDFLVTLPIDRGATATFNLDRNSDGITVLPRHKAKAQRLVRLMLDAYRWPGGGTLHLRGDLPEGKGLASSSADLVATARAVGAALGVPVEAETIERFLRGIEPTDGVMYPEVTAFYHREVRLREVLGPLPPLVIVGVEEGGVVDTVEFNRQSKRFSEADCAEYDRLLERISRAIRDGDVTTIGEVATASALMNEKLRPKRLLHQMIDVSRECGGLGVSIAHSGTFLGVLVAESDPECARKVQAIMDMAKTLADDVTVFRSFRSPAPLPL